MESAAISLTLVVAMSSNGVIGTQGNKMPWHIPTNIKRLKQLTDGKVTIMGRKTFESLGKPQTNRANIVLTKSTEFADKFSYKQPSVMAVTSWIAAYQLATWLAISYYQLSKKPDCLEVMVLGGESVYRDALRTATRMHVTYVQANITGNARFPLFNTTEWHAVKSVTCVDELALVDGCAKHVKLPYIYKVLERNPCKS